MNKDDIKIEGLITELFEKLPIPECEWDRIRTCLIEITKLRSMEGLTENILQFMSASADLITKGYDNIDFTKIVKCVMNIMFMVKDVCLPMTVLYFVVVAGMSIFTKLIDQRKVEEILKNILDEYSDAELLKECEGLEFELYHSAKYLCAIGARKLADHEISSLSAEVPFREGLKIMGKLAKRISNLQQQQIKNYFDNKPIEFQRLLQFINAYCSLATLKFGIMLHHYFLLLLSENSPCLADGIREALESQINSGKNLLRFLVRPTSETAIIHQFGNVLEEKVSINFLKEFDLKPNDLDHLCKGVYVMSCVAYTDSKVYIGERLKQSWWGKRDRGSQNHFTFKKVRGENMFQINSHLFKDYHLEGGLWVSFEKVKNGEPNEKYGIWKIVPVYGVDKVPEVCYILRPNESKDGLLYANDNENIRVKKITKQEYDKNQAFWTITRIKTDVSTSNDTDPRTDLRCDDETTDTNSTIESDRKADISSKTGTMTPIITTSVTVQEVDVSSKTGATISTVTVQTTPFKTRKIIEMYEGLTELSKKDKT